MQELIPFGNRILVLPDPAAEFYSEDAAIIKGAFQQEVPNEGTIVAVGYGAIAELTGTHIPMRLQPGLKVLYGKFSGSDVSLNGQDHKILREDEVLGTITGTYERPPAPAIEPAPAEDEPTEDAETRMQRLREAAGK